MSHSPQRIAPAIRPTVLGEEAGRAHGAKAGDRIAIMCREVYFPARTACASSCGLDALIA
ncbi:hypothetical protein [Candidatus Symbiopectobacterium sp. NZEC151]|uniref:hypothetical protein n=1 Tax=Candidatus Symbiopectobacterium sp. NZEC151 TaxID=2820470 RepID=UPI002227CC19|nr:hypothetical protein [Candidatus Symbiopectobacterium sp. NZEC151]MCW2474460.1 hypothetical protein [Candidatus Symbiopectobacterium sp. NZEC151]